MTERSRLLRLAGLASVCTAVLLTLLKAAAWWLTGSASVLASLLDSLMDLVSSVINALALGYATLPADDNHRFGHDKAEALAAYTQAILLGLSASGILYYAATRLNSTAPGLQQVGSGIWLMLAVLLLTLLLVLFQYWVIKRTGSALVAADSLHYRSDFLINISVIATLVAAGTLPWLDAVMAMAIALYIYYAAWGILRQAVGELLDQELPPAEDLRLLRIADGYPAVRGIHDLKTRRAGGRIFVQLHLEFASQTPLSVAHEAGAQVERDILALHPDAEVLIHMDPV